MRSPSDDPRFVAAVQLLERTGATTFRIGYSDEDDGDPIVWYAVATWRTIDAAHNVHRTGAAEAAASLHPTDAVLRLCEQVIDGGTCAHCGQPTIFDADPPSTDVVTGILERMGCRYAWDPELATFRRGCEGDT